MIQYKHDSVAAFEGYAGSSASGFRAEVEAQRRLGQLDDILVYFDERRAGAVPSGPAGPRIARALDAPADDLSPLPGMLTDRARLRTLLASLARTLHVGILADCFFDPSTALCLKQPAQAAASADEVKVVASVSTRPGARWVSSLSTPILSGSTGISRRRTSLPIEHKSS